MFVCARVRPHITVSVYTEVCVQRCACTKHACNTKGWLEWEGNGAEPGRCLSWKCASSVRLLVPAGDTGSPRASRHPTKIHAIHLAPARTTHAWAHTCGTSTRAHAHTHAHTRTRVACAPWSAPPESAPGSSGSWARHHTPPASPAGWDPGKTGRQSCQSGGRRSRSRHTPLPPRAPAARQRHPAEWALPEPMHASAHPCSLLSSCAHAHTNCRPPSAHMLRMSKCRQVHENPTHVWSGPGHSPLGAQAITSGVGLLHCSCQAASPLCALWHARQQPPPASCTAQ